MADEMQVTLPEGVLRPIIQAQVVAALQGQEQLIGDLVTFVLKQNVSSERTGYRSVPFLEFTCRHLLEGAIADSVREWIAGQKPAIQREVARQLRGQVRGIASRLVQSVADQAGESWQLKIDVKLGEDR